MTAQAASATSTRRRPPEGPGEGLAIEVSADLIGSLCETWPPSAPLAAAIGLALGERGEAPESVWIGWAWRRDLAERGRPITGREWDAIARYERGACGAEVYSLPAEVGQWLIERSCDPQGYREPLRFTLPAPSAVYGRAAKEGAAR